MTKTEKEIESLDVVLNPGTLPVITRAGRELKAQVFIHVKYSQGKLSLTGVIGPTPNGNAHGSCGQIVDELSNKELAPNGNWDIVKIMRLKSIWERYHLNDMQAGCEHQRIEKWNEVRINPQELPNSRANRDENGILAIWIYPAEHRLGLLCKPCSQCGYKYGSQWLFEKVPSEIIEQLSDMPRGLSQHPAWY